MSELPAGWAFANLGEVASFVMGQAPPGSASNFEGIGIPFVKAGEFGPLRPVIREWTTQPLKMAAETDVLICVVGATSGKINLGADCAIGRSVAAIRPTRGIDQFYLHGFMQTQVDALRTGSTGTAQGVISSVMLSNVQVPIAPLPEQRRIVAKVDGLTARTSRARKELDRIPILMARYKQRLLAMAFSGELTRGTENWQTATIGGLAETQLGKMLDKAKNKGESTRYLRNINVRWYDFELDDVLEMPMSEAERRKFSIEDGDILTCEGGEPGRSAIWHHGPTDLAFQKALIRIRPDLEQLNPSYLVHYLKYLADAQELERYFTGSTIKHLPQRALQSVELPVPPIEVQAEIVRRIESDFGWLDHMAADHTAAARLLPKLDAAILAKAFHGKLVPQDPNDEPACVLLERTKAERAAVPKVKRGRTGNLAAIEGSASDTINITGTATATVGPESPRKSSMTKSRQDDDIKGKPYLAGLLKSGRFSEAQKLFRAADLPVADFYKQLAWEIDQGHILDSADELRAA